MKFHPSSETDQYGHVDTTRAQRFELPRLTTAIVALADLPSPGPAGIALDGAYLRYEVGEGSELFAVLYIVPDGEVDPANGVQVSDRIDLNQTAGTKYPFVIIKNTSGHSPILEDGEALLVQFEEQITTSGSGGSGTLGSGGSGTGEDVITFGPLAPTALKELMIVPYLREALG